MAKASLVARDPLSDKPEWLEDIDADFIADVVAVGAELPDPEIDRKRTV